MDKINPISIQRTSTFTAWMQNLRDRRARAIIDRRLDRLNSGNFGKNRSVGSGVFELKIDFGPGYRVYYIQRGKQIVVLLCGGDKSTQSKDIDLAKSLAAQLD